MDSITSMLIFLYSVLGIVIAGYGCLVLYERRILKRRNAEPCDDD